MGTEVTVAGGYQVQIYGTCEVCLNMGSYQEIVPVIVLDLEAEFDLVLGMNWIQKHKVQFDWDTMMVNIIDGKGEKHIVIPLPRHL